MSERTAISELQQMSCRTGALVYKNNRHILQALVCCSCRLDIFTRTGQGPWFYPTCLNGVSLHVGVSLRDLESFEASDVVMKVVQHSECYNKFRVEGPKSEFFGCPFVSSSPASTQLARSMGCGWLHLTGVSSRQELLRPLFLVTHRVTNPNIPAIPTSSSAAQTLGPRERSDFSDATRGTKRRVGRTVSLDRG